MGVDIVIELIAWVTTIVIVISWLYASHTKKYVQFDWVNIVAMCILAPINISYGASFAAALNVTFGMGAMWSRWKDRSADVKHLDNVTSVAVEVVHDPTGRTTGHKHTSYYDSEGNRVA
jgi:hypothetical protein